MGVGAYVVALFAGVGNLRRPPPVVAVRVPADSELHLQINLINLIDLFRVSGLWIRV